MHLSAALADPCPLARLLMAVQDAGALLGSEPAEKKKKKKKKKKEKQKH